MSLLFIFITLLDNYLISHIQYPTKTNRHKVNFNINNHVSVLFIFTTLLDDYLISHI